MRYISPPAWQIDSSFQSQLDITEKNSASLRTLPKHTRWHYNFISRRCLKSGTHLYSCTNVWYSSDCIHEDRHACLCRPTTKSMFYCRLICSKHPQTSIGRLHWTMQKVLLSTLWIATSVDMSHEFSSVLYRQSFSNFRYFAIMPTTRLLFSRLSFFPDISLQFLPISVPGYRYLTGERFAIGDALHNT